MSSSNPTRSTPPPSFLSLPAELRLMIYGYLFQDIQTHRHPLPTYPTLSPKITPSLRLNPSMHITLITSFLPIAILSTCRTIHSEARPIFLQSAGVLHATPARIVVHLQRQGYVTHADVGSMSRLFGWIAQGSAIKEESPKATLRPAAASQPRPTRSRTKKQTPMTSLPKCKHPGILSLAKYVSNRPFISPPARLEILVLCTARKNWENGWPYMLLATQELVGALSGVDLSATMRLRAHDLEECRDPERQRWVDHVELEDEGGQRYGEVVGDEEWKGMW